jgi:valyl-tRNA synthetase
MARKAVDAVKTGELQFFPKSYDSTWFNWMTDIRYVVSDATYFR